LLNLFFTKMAYYPNIREPIGRECMRKLYSSEQEEVRIKKVKEIVSEIYDDVIGAAKICNHTSYNFKIPLPGQNKRLNQIYMENMRDILINLEYLFPGCSVVHTVLSAARDGKLYDISKLNSTTLPLVLYAMPNSYIVIDWT